MKILLIEDSKRLRETIGFALKKSGYAVDLADNGEDGFWLAESGTHDVIILDLMLPKMDGLTVLKKLRNQESKIHVLVLTAKDAVADRVKGLDAGADDYLTKPFSIDELLARVAALIRRKYEQKNPELHIENLLVNLNRQTVQIGETSLPLAPREYKLLEYLCCRAGELVTRQEIEEHLYEESAEMFSNVIDATVSILRRKMKDLACEPQIITRRGLGYILETPNE